MSNRSRKSEVGVRKSEVRDKKSEDRGQKTGASSIFFAGLLILAVSACSGEKSEGAKIQERLENSELMYFTNGKKLYTQYCANCHMENGEGLGKLIPPLKNADYLLEDIGRAARIIVNGVNEAIIVNGIEYTQPMPANSSLTAAEITGILTYVTNTWGNEFGGISLEEVSSALKK